MQNCFRNIEKTTHFNGFSRENVLTSAIQKPFSTFLSFPFFSNTQLYWPFTALIKNDSFLIKTWKLDWQRFWVTNIQKLLTTLVFQNFEKTDTFKPGLLFSKQVFLHLRVQFRISIAFSNNWSLDCVLRSTRIIFYRKLFPKIFMLLVFKEISKTCRHHNTIAYHLSSKWTWRFPKWAEGVYWLYSEVSQPIRKLLISTLLG